MCLVAVQLEDTLDEASTIPTISPAVRANRPKNPPTTNASVFLPTSTCPRSALCPSFQLFKAIFFVTIVGGGCRGSDGTVGCGSGRHLSREPSLTPQQPRMYQGRSGWLGGAPRAVRSTRTPTTSVDRTSFRLAHHCSSSPAQMVAGGAWTVSKSDEDSSGSRRHQGPLREAQDPGAIHRCGGGG